MDLLPPILELESSPWSEAELSTLTTFGCWQREGGVEEGNGKKKRRGGENVFIYTFPVQNKKVPPSAKEVFSSKIAAKEGELEYA